MRPLGSGNDMNGYYIIVIVTKNRVECKIELRLQPIPPLFTVF